MNNFLTIPEEITLLMIDEQGGESPQSKTFDVVLASSVLMDLAIRNNIDTDINHLIAVKNKKTDDNVLDEVSDFIFSKNITASPAFWIGQIGLMIDEIYETIIASLITKKVIKVENQKILWFFASRHYPVVGNEEIKEVKSRVRELVFGNELPDLRDVVIISLCYYGSMLSLLFSDEEATKYHHRIVQIARMDLIGQAIAKALEELSFTSQVSNIAKSVLGINKTSVEKLEEKVAELKQKYRIQKDEDLPEWLRKGTLQYAMTLKFVEEKGTANIYYHRLRKKYYVIKYQAQHHLFGAGE